MIYYKVVQKIERTLWSTSGKRTKYKVGIPIYRKENCGPFAVFETLEMAKRFIGPGAHFYKIFECEIIESSERCLYFMGGLPIKEKVLPYKTIFADMVKLIKEVN